MIELRSGRIPFLVIDRYAQRYGIGGAEFEILSQLLERLDRVFLEWEAGESQKRAAKMR